MRHTFILYTMSLKLWHDYHLLRWGYSVHVMNESHQQNHSSENISRKRQSSPFWGCLVLSSPHALVYLRLVAKTQPTFSPYTASHQPARGLYPISLPFPPSSFTLGLIRHALGCCVKSGYAFMVTILEASWPMVEDL